MVVGRACRGQASRAMLRVSRRLGAATPGRPATGSNRRQWGARGFAAARERKHPAGARWTSVTPDGVTGTRPGAAAETGGSAGGRLRLAGNQISHLGAQSAVDERNLARSPVGVHSGPTAAGRPPRDRASGRFEPRSPRPARRTRVLLRRAGTCGSL